MNKIKDGMAYFDRELGYLAYMRGCKFLQPQYDYDSTVTADEGMMKLFYPGITNKNSKENKYHQTFFESYEKILNCQLIIDSSTGWSFRYKVIPVWHSYPYAQYAWKSFMKPTLVWCQLKNVFLKPNNELQECINLIWYGWKNYYHFFVDLIPTLMKISNSKFRDLPILIPEQALQVHFVKDFFRLVPELLKLNFIAVKEGHRIKVQKRVIYIKASKFLEPVAEYFKKHAFFCDYRKIPSRKIERIFLYRPTEAIRALTNTSEIIELLEDEGFMCLDTSKMSLTDQISLFKDVKICIGIHGAGLTNLIFSKHQYFLIELTSNKKYIPWHYQELTNLLRGKHCFLQGSAPNSKFQFAINPNDLRFLLNQLRIGNE